MPVQGPIHVNRPLTNISIGYRSSGMIADSLFPAVPVMKESDLYYVFDKAQSLRTPETRRANGAESNEDNLLLSTASYSLEFHALKEIITRRDRANQDPGVNLDMATTEDLTGKIQRRREKNAAELLFTNGNWANESSLAAADAWSANTTTSNPILVADSANAAVLLNCGLKPNTCVMDYRTFLAVKEHVSIVDRVKHTSSDSVTPQMIARLFGQPNLLIAEGVENGAKEGLAASMQYIWTDSAWFGYVERSPGLKKPSALYCFKQGGGATVRKFPDRKRDGDWVEVEQNYDQQSPASDCGYHVVNTVQ